MGTGIAPSQTDPGQGFPLGNVTALLLALKILSVHIYVFAVGRHSTVDKLFLSLSFAQAYSPRKNLEHK